MNISVNKALLRLGLFIAIFVLLRTVSDDTQSVLLPVLFVAGFVYSVIKAPPIAIAMLLYYSMISGGWFILIAAPGTMLLARRYQRQWLKVDLNPDHIRRTALLAMAALVATLPFLAASLGAWSSRAQGRAINSASPLVPTDGSAQDGALQRFARWLGFGDDGPFRPGEFDSLQPFPVRPNDPDDPFNWWIIVAIVVIIGLLVLAWWLWSRRKPPAAPVFVPESARPLARLEAVGAQIGRPRSPSEGAITYGRELAKRTGDPRLAEAGPLVSSQIYESAFANPNKVDSSLTGIEATPPPPLPQPSFGERLAQRWQRFRLSPRAVLVGLLLVAVTVAVGWVVLPRLGDLDDDNRFEFGAELVDHDAEVTTL